VCVVSRTCGEQERDYVRRSERVRARGYVLYTPICTYLLNTYTKHAIYTYLRAIYMYIARLRAINPHTPNIYTTFRCI
jgi:hypothetical protein